MSNVLIVEDNKFFREIYEDKLSKSGHSIVSYSDPYMAMEYMSENNLPDVIVLDILLPGVNGVALIHELQSYGDMRNIPIVVCSSVSSKIDKKTQVGYGITALLDKNTMELEDLVHAVNGALK